VIHIIRNSDEPKAALIERFKLSEIQAEDILEIRLRQLARLEAIKIEQELAELRKEKQMLQDLLDNPASMKRAIIKEIESDAKTYGDARRTLIEEAQKAVVEQKVVDEPVTVIISEKGWMRAQRHRPRRHAVHLQGRRQPVRRLRMPHGRQPAGLRQQRQDLLGGGGAAERARRRRAGDHPDRPGAGAPAALLRRRRRHACCWPPAPVSASRARLATWSAATRAARPSSRSTKATAAAADRDPGHRQRGGDCRRARAVLVFGMDEMKVLTNGGRGVILMELADKETLLAAKPISQKGVTVYGTGRGGKRRKRSCRHRRWRSTSASARAKARLATKIKPTGLVPIV
jgi:topoisomerase-4 subunit A